MLYNTLAEKKDIKQKEYKITEEGKEKKLINIKKAQEARKKKIEERKNTIKNDSSDNDVKPNNKINIELDDIVYVESDEEYEVKKPKNTKINNDDKLIDLLNSINSKIEIQQKKVDKLYYMKKNKITNPTSKNEEKQIIIQNHLPNQQEDPIFNAIRSKIINHK